jgi:hypothetical protein
MSVPWSPSLRRSLTATLPVANRSIEAADRRHVLFVSPRRLKAIARDGEGRAIRQGRVSFFLAGAAVAVEDSAGALAAAGFTPGAFAATGSVT